MAIARDVERDNQPHVCSITVRRNNRQRCQIYPNPALAKEEWNKLRYYLVPLLHHPAAKKIKNISMGWKHFTYKEHLCPSPALTWLKLPHIAGSSARGNETKILTFLRLT